MYVYPKIGFIIAFILAATSVDASEPNSVTIKLRRNSENHCASYQSCARLGTLVADRHRAGIYGIVTSSEKRCTQMLLNASQLNVAIALIGKTARVAGINLPRLSKVNEADVFMQTTYYFDRTLVEGGCDEAFYVIYVTSIQQAK